MASRKSEHKDVPKQKNIEDLIELIVQNLGESSGASQNTQLIQSSDLSPGKYSDGYKKNIAKVLSRILTQGASKRACSIGTEEQQDSGLKKARTESIEELRYRCSFCSERFPSLTNVRDHTRFCHREENERRKAERLNINAGTRATANKNVESDMQAQLTRDQERKHIIFVCIECLFASIFYDNMIEHCQNHIIEMENPQAAPYVKTKPYNLGDKRVYVDMDTYNDRRIDLTHSHSVIHCDYHFLKHDKCPGIFSNVPKSEIDKIHSTSVYYFTRIIRLTSRKKPTTAPFMVFQCQNCMKYVNPHSLISHLQENLCDEKDPDYPCSVCNIPFHDENTRYLHYKMHKTADISNMKFRKICFNRREDYLYNTVLLKAAGYVMQNVPIITKDKGKSVVTTETEVKNKQSNQAANDMQSAPAGSKTILVSDAERKMLLQNDARSMIIQRPSKAGAQEKISRISSTVTKTVDKVDTVYKCKCELCFHGLEYLLEHLETCHLESTTIISCICGLLFNEQQYQIHYSCHAQGFTKLNIKTISVAKEEIVALNNNNGDVDDKLKQIEYNELCRKAISKLIETIKNVALAFPHDKGYKKAEFTTQKMITAAGKSVGSATDDLIELDYKTQGTMTDEVKDIDDKKHASTTKSVGTETDSLNTKVMKSQGTMTMQTFNTVNKGVNVNKLDKTKPVWSATNYLNVPIIVSQESHRNLTNPEKQPVFILPDVEKHKWLNALKRKMRSSADDLTFKDQKVDKTKSVWSATDHLNAPVILSQESQCAMTNPEKQPVFKVNRCVGCISQVLNQTNSLRSETENFDRFYTNILADVEKQNKILNVIKGKNKSSVDDLTLKDQKGIITKSVWSATGDFNAPIIVSQESQHTMTNPENQTVPKVNRCVDSINQVSQTNSLRSETHNFDRFYKVTPADVEKRNKFLNVIKAKMKSSADDLTLKDQKVNKTNIEGRNKLQISVDKLIENTKGVFGKEILTDVEKHNIILNNTRQGKTNLTLSADDLMLKEQKVDKTFMEGRNKLQFPVNKLIGDTRGVHDKVVDSIKQVSQTNSLRPGTEDCDRFCKEILSGVEKHNKILNDITQGKAKLTSSAVEVMLKELQKIDKTFMEGRNKLQFPVNKLIGHTTGVHDKGADSIKQVSQTNSLRPRTEDSDRLCEDILTRVEKHNKILNDMNQGKTNLTSSVYQKVDKTMVEERNKLQISFDKLIGHTRGVQEVELAYYKPYRIDFNQSTKSDNTESQPIFKSTLDAINRSSNTDKQPIFKSTLDAINNETPATEKSKLHCDIEPNGGKKESGDISTMKSDDNNTTNIKLSEQIDVHTNKNDGINVIETQTENNNKLGEVIEIDESDNEDTNTSQDVRKIYTEDELLSGPEMPVYYDAEESILTDDEDPILLYEDDID